MSRFFTVLACFALVFACVGCGPKAKTVKKKPVSGDKADQATPEKTGGDEGLPPGTNPTAPVNPTNPAKPPGTGF